MEYPDYPVSRERTLFEVLSFSTSYVLHYVQESDIK